MPQKSAQLNPANESTDSSSESLQAVANSEAVNSQEVALPAVAEALTAAAWLQADQTLAGEPVVQPEWLVQRLNHREIAAASADSGQPHLSSFSGDFFVSGFRGLADATANTTGSTPDMTLWLPHPGDVVWQVSAAALAAREAAGNSRDVRVELQLNPPDLGRVWIELTDTQDGLQARIVCSRESSFQLLKGDLAALRSSLEGAGVNVSEFHVGHDGQRSDGSTSRWDRDDFTGVRPFRLTRRRATPMDVEPPEANFIVWRRPGRVDLRL